jgi:glycine hydroxymethyltransferase
MNRENAVSENAVLDRLNTPLRDVDPEIAEILELEAQRQATGLELIPSENFVSEAVLEAMGSVLTNKYAEGYPHKRYYGGCEIVDRAEQLAIDRAKALFGADHANVQAHSGTQANIAVYMTALQPGDTVLGMNLAHGGHLTHGHPLNFSGRTYHFIAYGVRKDTEQIDYDEIERLAAEHKPKMIVAGASAYARIIDFPRMAKIAEGAGAVLFVDMAHIAGLVAAGVHPSPVPHADFVSTTTHKTLRGPRGGAIVCREEHAKKIDSAVFPGQQGGPLEHAIAAKAVAFKEAALPSFATYTDQIVANAQAFGAALAKEGFRNVSGGTENHMVLLDLREFDEELTGKVAQEVLDRAGITTNRNTIPDDPRSAFITSGLRVGTAAQTTAGMNEGEFVAIAQMMATALRNREDEEAVKAVRREVATLCDGFNPYANFTKQ